jgi:hypothetical protein
MMSQKSLEPKPPTMDIGFFFFFFFFCLLTALIGSSGVDVKSGGFAELCSAFSLVPHQQLTCRCMFQHLPGVIYYYNPCWQLR